MKDGFILFVVLCLCCIHNGFAQEKPHDIKYIKSEQVLKDQVESQYKPLAPAKAAFYSAVLPGLGQAFNHRYWKIPLIYAALGTSIYFYVMNDEHYDRYRKAYKRRLAGYQDDEYQGRLSTQGLIEAQKIYKRNKEISIISTVVIYALNIIWANVTAHLNQFNVNTKLSLRPHYDFNQMTGKSNYGFTVNFKL